MNSVEFCSILRFLLLDGIMAALLLVGYLCCEECTSDNLCQFQTAPNTLSFLSHSFQFCPSFLSGLDPDLKHQYSCVYGQIHVLSLNTGRYILPPPSETVYWLRRTTDLTYFCISYILWWQAEEAEFLSSQLLSIYGDFCCVHKGV